MSFERIIRTVVGLRPHRPSGFVVRTEKAGDKWIVHNYGHGGGGVTLSWGTGHLAMEEALRLGQSRYAVLGCGAVGLAAARLLQRKGGDVTIYARDLPPATTSNIAGAQWSPTSVIDPTQAPPEAREQFIRAARLSYRYFQDLVGDYYGVRWIENYSMHTGADQSFLSAPGLDLIPDLYPGVKQLRREEHPFPADYCTRFLTMLIEPPVYLNAVLRDFQIGGGRVAVREFADVAGILALPEPVIVNCTGLGAKALFNDPDLVPIKGQLSFVPPQPEVDYITVGVPGYMFPRRDGILLGGTHERGVWSLEPNQEARERIIRGHMEFNRNLATDGHR